MSSKKEVLLEWVKEITASYENVNIENLSSSFADGLAFCAIIHHHHPELIEYSTLSSENAEHNLKLAFNKGVELGIGKVMKVEDVVNGAVEQLSMIAYLTSMHKHLVKARNGNGGSGSGNGSGGNGSGTPGANVDIQIEGVDDSAINKVLERRDLLRKNSASPSGRRNSNRPFSPFPSSPEFGHDMTASSPILEKRTIELEQKGKELETMRLKLVEAEQHNKELQHKLKNYQAEETKKVAQRDEEIKGLRKDRKKANDKAARLAMELEGAQAELKEANEHVEKLKNVRKVVRQETGDARVDELEAMLETIDADNKILQKNLNDKIREINEIKVSRVSSQGNIYLLEEQLKEAKDRVAHLERQAQRDALVKNLENKVQSLKEEVLDRKEILEEERRKLATQLWELEDLLADERSTRGALEREKTKLLTMYEQAKLKAQLEQTERERIDNINEQLRRQLEDARAMWRKSEEAHLNLERNKTVKLEQEVRRLSFEVETVNSRSIELEKAKSKLQLELKNFKQSIQIESGEKSKHEDVRKIVERQLEDLKERLASEQVAKERAVRTLTAELETLRPRVEQLESEKRALTEENRKLSVSLNGIEDEHKEVSLAVAQLESKKRKAESDYEDARKNAIKLAREKEDLEEKIRRMERQSQLLTGSSSNEAQARLERLVAKMEAQAKELNNDLTTEIELKQDAVRDKRNMEREMKKMQRDVETERKRSAAAEEERLRLNKDIQNLRKEISDMDSKLRTLTREKADLMRERLMNQIK